MSIALALLLLVVAVAVIGYPFFVTRRSRPEQARTAPEATGPSMLGELKSDYETGILCKEEYDELRKDRNEPAARVGAGVATPAPDDEIERRVRDMRARGKGAPAKPQQRPVAASGKCPKCGQPSKPSDRFCTRCGARLVPGGER